MLIHRAYDLALATSYTFCGEYPEFQSIDEISFQYPVDIGDLIKLKSRVVYVQNNLEGCGKGDSRKEEEGCTSSVLQVEVTCEIIKLDLLSSIISNTFDFVFSIDVDQDIKSTSTSTSTSLVKYHRLKEIAPATLEEASVYMKAEANFYK